MITRNGNREHVYGGAHWSPIKLDYKLPCDVQDYVGDVELAISVHGLPEMKNGRGFR
jgi:hypothetical protein